MDVSHGKHFIVQLIFVPENMVGISVQILIFSAAKIIKYFYVLSLIKVTNHSDRQGLIARFFQSSFC